MTHLVSSLQMLRRDQLAHAVEGVLQQMEEDQARLRPGGSLVSTRCKPEWCMPCSAQAARDMCPAFGMAVVGW